ncbi:hypothetical protein ACFXPS_05630 [Nocardia sp. NPDC059091]|uniref:hypothetical protein n=1 Tax=unclassified Nocardia TaxID=2637762 RepID=UPI00369AEAF7
MLSTKGAFRGGQHPIRVDFTLEFAREGLPGLCSTRCTILGLRPRHMSRDPGLEHSIFVRAHAAPPDATGRTNETTSA